MAERNGCSPCECVPSTGCLSDRECGPDAECVPGDFCLDFCPIGDPSCCFGNACRPTGLTCDGPNPAGCRTTGCAPQQICSTDLADGCAASTCFCDPANGSWACTDDCGGGVCMPASAGICDSDDDCGFGAEWCEGGQCVACDNGGLLCDMACPPGTDYAERNGCFPCACVPVNACTSDLDCGPGATCEPGDLCLDWCPAGDPACCSGNVCRPITQWCEGPVPAGCVQTGCAPTEVCDQGTGGCLPSSCSCDFASGSWVCTDDCGGGICRPAQGDECDGDSDCSWGTNWCEEGACVECDNSGLICDRACPPGTHMPTRNGCFPCECVPNNECLSDRDCRDGLRCVPGDVCADWCAVGDPACCSGNTCQ
jgi:hypothetical protein